MEENTLFLSILYFFKIIKNYLSFMGPSHYKPIRDFKLAERKREHSLHLTPYLSLHLSKN